MVRFDYSVFIGRFNPFHLAHKQLLNTALKIANKTIIVLGSWKKSPDIRNPFSAEQREQMVRSSCSQEENDRIQFVYIRDHLYSDNLWLKELQEKISAITNESNNIALVGHKHDNSSYYIDLMPQWSSWNMDNIDSLPHATEIRNLYFEGNADYKLYVPEQVSLFMEQFKTTKAFAHLKDEYDYVIKYKQSWATSPFPPIFSTTDCLVVKSGHLLVIKRKCNPGKGLIALPGGFLMQEETILNGALRELKEETSINVSKDVLKKSIAANFTADSPLRSVRGRTISNVFYIDLGAGPLPKVKGMDDAKLCKWLPLSDLDKNEELFFEDHFHIINKLISR